MSLTPTESTRHIVMKSFAPIRYEGYEENLNIKCLFPPPCLWDTEKYDLIYDDIHRRFSSWLTENNLEFEDDIATNHLDLRGAIKLALYDLPLKWRQAYLKDQSSIEGHYCYTLFLVATVAFFWDDVLDFYTGQPQFSDYTKAVMDIVDRVMAQEFGNLLELQNYLSVRQSIFLDPKFKLLLAMQQQIAQDLRDVSGIQTKDYPHFLTEYHAAYDYLTWFDDNGLGGILNLKKRDYSRPYSSGARVWMEFYFLLAKLQLPIKIRDDKYWRRAYYLSALIITIVNDFASLEKESTLEHTDNQICALVKSGVDLGAAIARTVAYYNKVVVELNEIIGYVKGGNHQLPSDSNPTLSAKLEESYMESLELMMGAPGGVWQCHLACKRYSVAYHFE